MITIDALNPNNFHHFIALLRERGAATDTYYQWKYLEQPDTFFATGFIAYLDQKPVGCIGIINKLFVDESLVMHEATWFADWYVNTEARGHGIGLALMQKAASLSPYAFGIPGPETAQIIAEKAGYKKQQNYFELIVPVQPYAFGFRRYRSHFFKNVLRGLKAMWQCGSIEKDLTIQIKNINDANELFFSKIENSFLQTNAYFNWLLKMPIAKEEEKKWYKISKGAHFIIIFVENDAKKIKRARLVYDTFGKNTQKKMEFINRIRYQLANENIVYLQLYSHFEDKAIDIPNEYKKQVPQTISFETRNAPLLSISEMESRWKDVKMKA